MKNLLAKLKRSPVKNPSKKEEHKHECACGGNCGHNHGEATAKEAHQCACGHH